MPPAGWITRYWQHDDLDRCTNVTLDSDVDQHRFRMTAVAVRDVVCAMLKIRRSFKRQKKEKYSNDERQ
jgi:hypothetical protein